MNTKKPKRPAPIDGRQIFKTQAELDRFVTEGGRGRAWHVTTLHDDGCTPECCTCKPWFVVQLLTEETFLAGQQAQAKWAWARRPN